MSLVLDSKISYTTHVCGSGLPTVMLLQSNRCCHLHPACANHRC